MGARAISTVTVSLGLMSIGIKLYLSAKSEQMSFNMINPKTGHRVKQVLVDEDDFDTESKTVVNNAEIINRNATLKGYEYQKGKYITFTDEEVSNMAAEARDTLDIKEFVPVSEINPLHIEKTMYLGPSKGADKGYAILREVLKSDGKAAIGTWVSRGREHLVAIRAYDHGLVLHQMFYDTEVRTFDNTCKKVNVPAGELAMAKLLVEQFSSDTWDKSKYSDKFVERVQNAVDTKLNGGEISASAPAKLTSATEDALRESLEKMGIPKDKIEVALAEARATEKKAV